jgi:hypothetical protein
VRAGRLGWCCAKRPKGRNRRWAGLEKGKRDREREGVLNFYVFGIFTHSNTNYATKI